MVQLGIQFRTDLRDKGQLMVYYLVPLVFFLVMGNIMKMVAPDSGSTESLTLNITIFALSMSAFLGMPAALVKAREQGVLEAYRAAGIPAWSLPVATIIISTVHMMLVAGIILLAAPVVFDAARPPSFPAYLLTVLAVALCSQALGALVACFVKRQNTMTLAAQCLFLPSILFSGIMFPAKLLPKPMQWIGQALPATQGARLFDGTALQTTALLVLLGVTGGAFLVAAQRFRRISQRA
jgi:ABC-2 type transport system permease protein